MQTNLFIWCSGVSIGWCAAAFFSGNTFLLAVWGLVMTLIAAIAVFKVLRENSSSSCRCPDIAILCQPEMSIPTDEPDAASLNAHCKEIASAHNLTMRETDVFLLLTKGRNAGSIQERLCISNATAKTHIYRIYRKFGIHSQQELLNLIENYEESTQKTSYTNRGLVTAGK